MAMTPGEQFVAANFDLIDEAAARLASDTFADRLAAQSQLAAAVDAAIREAVAAERDRCARIADEGYEREGVSGQGESPWVAARIREGCQM